MSTITMAETTPIENEEVAVPQQVGPTIRVALREIREYAYRALVVTGASPGEATTAAGQVLHAEIHAGDGLVGLVSDLTRVPWPRTGLTRTRRPGPRPVLEVSCGERAGELRVGAALIELAAGEEGPVAVTTTADVQVTALLDEVLLSAASATGTTIAALRATPHDRFVTRLATPDGVFAHGLVDHGAVPALAALVGVSGSDQLIVLTDVLVDEPARTQLTWSSGVQRAALRREAALHGLEVDAGAWRAVAQQAQLFLVPEREV